jgi:hypothetical protein
VPLGLTLAFTLKRKRTSRRFGVADPDGTPMQIPSTRESRMLSRVRSQAGLSERRISTAETVAMHQRGYAAGI